MAILGRPAGLRLQCVVEGHAYQAVSASGHLSEDVVQWPAATFLKSRQVDAARNLVGPGTGAEPLRRLTVTTHGANRSDPEERLGIDEQVHAPIAAARFGGRLKAAGDPQCSRGKPVKAPMRC